MERFTFINLEWNMWNGVCFEILHIDYGKLDRSLLGINISKEFFYIDLLYFNIKIFHPLADNF